MRICVPGGNRSRPVAAAAGAAALAATGAAVLAPSALTASAQAAVTPAVIHVNKACYVRKGTVPPMTVTGKGFVPNAQVTITDSTGTVDHTTTANAAGLIGVKFPGPAPLSLRRKPAVIKDVVTAEQVSGATEVKGTTKTSVTILAAGHGATRTRPGLRALSEKTTWSFYGFPTGKQIWGHYTIKGKQVARQSFGKAKGPCGVLKTRRKLFPAKPKYTSYPLQLDNRKTFSKKTRPALPLKIGLVLEF